MRKNVLLGASLLAMVAMLGAPLAQAGENHAQYVSPAGDAADKEGDRNGIGQFNKQEGNKALKKIEGKITAVSLTSVTVQVGSDDDDDGEVTLTNYTFAIDATTKVIRRFRGSATVDELGVGHKVKIYATALTEGTAKLIWDKSIWWLRLGGKITMLNDENKTFKLMIPRRNKEGNLKTFLVMVKTNDNTVYVHEDGVTPVTWDDLDNMDTVRIRGSWNNVSKYLLAKKITLVAD